MNHADCFMPERKAVPITDRTRHGVSVRSTDQRCGRANDGINRTRSWNRLLDHADLADAMHHEAFHCLGHWELLGLIAIHLTNSTTTRGSTEQRPITLHSEIAGTVCRTGIPAFIIGTTAERGTFAFLVECNRNDNDDE